LRENPYTFWSGAIREQAIGPRALKSDGWMIEMRTAVSSDRLRVITAYGDKFIPGTRNAHREMRADVKGNAWIAESASLSRTLGNCYSARISLRLVVTCSGRLPHITIGAHGHTQALSWVHSERYWIKFSSPKPKGVSYHRKQLILQESKMNELCKNVKLALEPFPRQRYDKALSSSARQREWEWRATVPWGGLHALFFSGHNIIVHVDALAGKCRGWIMKCVYSRNYIYHTVIRL
jgi:hypothetical protein